MIDIYLMSTKIPKVSMVFFNVVLFNRLFIALHMDSSYVNMEKIKLWILLKSIFRIYWNHLSYIVYIHYSFDSSVKSSQKNHDIQLTAQKLILPYFFLFPLNSLAIGKTTHIYFMCVLQLTSRSLYVSCFSPIWQKWQT